MNIWQFLDYPIIWEASRVGLDLTFGLYRKRIKVMQEWKLLEKSPSIIDIGCGIGPYAAVTKGRYLGIDLNTPYIAYARKRHRGDNQSFRCADVTELLEENVTFDLALMVDILHHLPDEQAVKVLGEASRLANQYLVSFEPITYQPHAFGRWVVKHDRGCCVRPLDELHGLFTKAGLSILKTIELPLGPMNTRAILAAPSEMAT